MSAHYDVRNRFQVLPAPRQGGSGHGMRMRRIREWILCWLVAGVLPGAAAAQTDEMGVRAVVDRMFEGMRTADVQMVRSVLASTARFAVVEARAGVSTISSQTTDGWVQAIGGSEGRWNEQIYDVVVLVDGDMASVWAPYTFYLDGAVSHCGINSIELLREREGWKVTQLSDTRRTQDCPDPLGDAWVSDPAPN